MNNIHKHDDVTAIILAGGQARRMDGVDKGLVELNHKAMIEYVIDNIKNQTDWIIINANRNQDIYEQYQYPVIPDDIPDYAGPLSGIASCLKLTLTRFIVTCPCDSPFVPHNLIQRLHNNLEDNQSDISVAHDGERMQPVFSLIKVSLLPSLLDYLSSGERKIDRWFQQHRLSLCDFSDNKDAFININTLEEKAAIEKKLNE